MRGEVLHYDDASGQGFIAGDDGRRYVFRREALAASGPLRKGTPVEFSAEGDLARDLSIPTGAGAHGRPVRFGRFADRDEPPRNSLFGYFLSSVTRDYARFRGRARRKEFWGFMLFLYIGLAIAAAAGWAADTGLGNLDRGEPWLMIALPTLFGLAALIPSVAAMVRRQHDIGLSGWFFFLILIPSVGSLILLVFALIPSQKNDNRWGSVPEGIR
jgi:uncharacterized membrane protein YhaH (DUF805 family)/cold shock CspA family protein